MISIGFTNESTVLTDGQVEAAVACLQVQVEEDFGPAYEWYATLVFLSKGQVPIPGQWQLVFADNSDQADALGYHEVTANGDPIGYVFAKSDIDAGTSWTVTASHELLEMLVDPDITTVEEQDNGDGTMTFRSKEICDVCEDDSLAYKKTDALGVIHSLPDGSPFLFSDFILPAFWNPIAPAGSKFDFCGHITKPLEILPGGYISILQVPSSAQWGQVQADLSPGGKAIHKLSRRARRMTKDREWRRSER